MSAPKLLKVIQVGHEERLTDGRWILLSSVESYDAFVCVRTVEATWRGPQSAHEQVETWLLQDDLGTEYEWHGGGWGGSGDVSIGFVTFTPEAPAEASRFYVYPPMLPRDGRPIEVQIS